MKTRIQHATVVFPEGPVDVDVVIEGSRIADIDPASQLPVDEVIDATGLQLFKNQGFLQHRIKADCEKFHLSMGHVIVVPFARKYVKCERKCGHRATNPHKSGNQEPECLPN